MNGFQTVASYLCVFLVCLPVSHGLDWIASLVTSDAIMSFLLLHIPILLLSIKSCDLKHLGWLVLTVAHGIAHIVDRPYIGTIFNASYSPFYDYVVHAAQCLTVYYSPHTTMIPVGVFFCVTMYVAGTIAYMSPEFLATNTWIVMSSGGVFGAVYHHMMLSKKHTVSMFVANCIIWTIPYVGYLERSMIPENDALLNKIGLFRLWFFNYYLVARIIGWMDREKIA